MYTRLLLFTLVILYWSPCCCACAAIWASAASRVDAVAETLWAKLPKEIRDRAETTTKVLMDFMAKFLLDF